MASFLSSGWIMLHKDCSFLLLVYVSSLDYQIFENPTRWTTDFSPPHNFSDSYMSTSIASIFQHTPSPQNTTAVWHKSVVCSPLLQLLVQCLCGGQTRPQGPRPPLGCSPVHCQAKRWSACGQRYLEFLAGSID